MTTYTLWPCPDEDAFRSDFDDRYYVAKDYADWQRRRAERAEALLREATSGYVYPRSSKRGMSTGKIPTLHDADALLSRVAAHFDQVKP